MVGAALRPGDIVWVVFDPAYGHEQAGRRPALVLSLESYNAISSVILICPITRSQSGWPFLVAVDAGSGIEGSVIVDQIRAVDRRRIVAAANARLSDACMNEVRGKLAALTGMVF